MKERRERFERLYAALLDLSTHDFPVEEQVKYYRLKRKLINLIGNRGGSTRNVAHSRITELMEELTQQREEKKTMSRFVVLGEACCTVSIEVEAPDKDTAMQMVRDGGHTVKQYVGNGGSNKLVGVDQPDEAIEPPEVIDWFCVEEGDA